jgi:RNA-binding protein YhbY
MALNIGDQGATTGMTKEIYDKLNDLLKPKVPDANLADAQAGWKELSFAIATGVVTHIVKNAEVTNVSVSGNVTLPVAANNAAGSVSLPQSSASGKVK